MKGIWCLVNRIVVAVQVSIVAYTNILINFSRDQKANKCWPRNISENVDRGGEFRLQKRDLFLGVGGLQLKNVCRESKNQLC